MNKTGSFDCISTVILVIKAIFAKNTLFYMLTRKWRFPLTLGFFFIWSTADILITIFQIHSQNIPLERRGKNTKEKVYFYWNMLSVGRWQQKLTKIANFGKSRSKCQNKTFSWKNRVGVLGLGYVIQKISSLGKKL